MPSARPAPSGKPSRTDSTARAARAPSPASAEPVAHQALYRRWRAQTFAEIVGQTAVVETLRNAVRLERVSHGLLFVGPRGTGKTSMARIVAKAINCANQRDGEPCDACPSCVSIREGSALDVVEMDAASNNRVDDMRELLPRVYTAAADVRVKVFIVDEVQRIKEGWDVLLKTLEEPPDDVVFIFCTTNPAQIRPAVVSRLQRYTFRPLTIEEISGKLHRILEREGRGADDDAIRLIAELASGGMRDAESMLDQLFSSAVDSLTADSVRDLLGLAEGAEVDGFIDALAAGDALEGVRALDRLEANGRDLVAFADQVVARLRERLVARLTAVEPSSAPRSLSAAALARVARRLTRLDATRAGAGGYRFQLELALLEGAAESDHVPTLDQAREATAPTAATAPAPRAPPSAALAIPTAAKDKTVARPEKSPRSAEPRVPVVESDGRETPVPENAVAPETRTPSANPLEELRRGWPQVVAHVSRNPANRPLIAACRPVEVQEHVVVLGFPEDQAFLRDIAERKRSALEEGVRAVLGPSYAVRCVAANVEMLPPVASDEALDLVEHARRIFEGELADVAEIS